ncbi:hypothetical protein [Clostridioides difficile]
MITSGWSLYFQSIVSASHLIEVYPNALAAFTVSGPKEPAGA